MTKQQASRPPRIGEAIGATIGSVLANFMAGAAWAGGFFIVAKWLGVF